MAFTPIGDTLKHKKNAPGIKKQIESAEAIDAATAVFEELFGSEASKVKPLFVKNRTLTVTCSSASVAGEIRINQQMIVEKINQKTGTSEIDRIRYLA